MTDNQYNIVISFEGAKVQTLISIIRAYFGQFKRPRGLLRLLQLMFAICAFATVFSGGSSFSISKNNKSDAIVASWAYPYHLRDTFMAISFGNHTRQPLSSSIDIVPLAEFFVFAGVTSMLLSLAFTVLYAIIDGQYPNVEYFRMFDLITTILWATFWIAISSAWAQGVSNIRSETNPEYVATKISGCSHIPKCEIYRYGTYTNIIISVIFGFLNFFLWFSSIWFVYKETSLSETSHGTLVMLNSDIE